MWPSPRGHDTVHGRHIVFILSSYCLRFVSVRHGMAYQHNCLLLLSFQMHAQICAHNHTFFKLQYCTILCFVEGGYPCLPNNCIIVGGIRNQLAPSRNRLFYVPNHPDCVNAALIILFCAQSCRYADRARVPHTSYLNGRAQKNPPFVTVCLLIVLYLFIKYNCSTLRQTADHPTYYSIYIKLVLIL